MIHGRKPALDLDRGCRDPVNAYSARPTGKSIGVDHFVVAGARRAEEGRPLLEVQSPIIDEIAAMLHHLSMFTGIFRDQCRSLRN
jgi:hypothetical protein